MTVVQTYSSSSSSCSFCYQEIFESSTLLKKGETSKPVALIVYSSFRRVATTGTRNSSVATRSCNSVSRTQISNDYGVNPY